MANVWFCYEGPEPTGREPAYELSIAECQKVLGMRQSNYRGNLSTTLSFNRDSVLGKFAGYKHVVVAISVTESASSEWKAGFYLLQISPDDVIARMSAAVA